MLSYLLILPRQVLYECKRKRKMITNFWTELERLYYYLNINNKQVQNLKEFFLEQQ